MVSQAAANCSYLSTNAAPTHHPSRYAFTLHGMWPQRRDGTWPEYCDPSSHLDVDNIDDLVDEMERDWPSWSSTDEVSSGEGGRGEPGKREGPAADQPTGGNAGPGWT